MTQSRQQECDKERNPFKYIKKWSSFTNTLEKRRKPKNAFFERLIGA